MSETFELVTIVQNMFFSMGYQLGQSINSLKLYLNQAPPTCKRLIHLVFRLPTLKPSWLLLKQVTVTEMPLLASNKHYCEWVSQCGKYRVTHNTTVLRSIQLLTYLISYYLPLFLFYTEVCAPQCTLLQPFGCLLSLIYSAKFTTLGLQFTHYYNMVWGIQF